jgi:outer membrane protein assembly factor BamB
MVSARGRFFTILDEGQTSLMHFPPRWRLVARDAFSGALLWKRSIPSWENALRAFRSGPPQLPRRLVAVGDRVYVTLGLTAPVSAIDATSGKTLATYDDTAYADEILCLGETLLVVTFDFASQEAAKEALRRGIPTTAGSRAILAVDAKSAKTLWRQAGDATQGLMPGTLAASADRVLYQCGTDIVCAELASGKTFWRKTTSPAKAKPIVKKRKSGLGAAYYSPTLVVHDGVVLSATGATLTALSLDDGRVLWTGESKPDFHAPADLFVAGGLVWSGLFATEGLDLKTGKVRRTLDITGLLTPGHHPRCYRNKATDRCVISGKRGLEFFDLADKTHSRNNWARGGCQYGMMPCNGLVYLPPNACCCYPGAMVHGFYALAATSRMPRDDSPRLQTGVPIDNRKSATGNPQDWPTFRGDPARRGSSPAAVPAAPVKRWATNVGGKLTAPVVGEGVLLVASVHRRAVTALDVATGKALWTYVAGGRVDTPPTIHDGGAYFGAANGWVTCLRLSDGEVVWKFRAAPADRRIVVDEQLESVWPLHGSVLVLDGVVYFVAGRSCYLDSGIFLYALDARTGRLLHQARIAIPHDQDKSQAFIMAGVRPDVLVTDGKYIYLQKMKFDRGLVRQEGLGRHLLCHSGLADDTWFYRTFWRLGRGDAYDFPNSYIKHELRVPFGQLLVFDDETVCGLQTTMSPSIRPTESRTGGRGTLLFGDPNRPFAPDRDAGEESDYPPKARIQKSPRPHRWEVKLPFQARAMVLASDRLFVAGWPDVVPGDDPYAAAEGRKGGLLWVFSKSEGRKLAEHALESPPVFDGLIAAQGRLYLADRAGRVVCFGGE